MTGVANYLASLSYDISIVSLSSRQGRGYFPLDENIKISHLNSYSYTNRGVFPKIWGRISSVYKFYKTMRNVHADIYIGTSVNTNVLSLLFCSSNKVVGCEHFSATAPMNPILRKFRNLMYKKLARLIVLTKHAYDYYAQLGVKVEVIPNSVAFNISPNFPVKTKIALAIGRHSQEKGFDRLLSIWKNVESIRTDWELLIIGEGDLFEYNQNVANTLGLKTVRFLPFQKNIQPYYQNASLYLMTSLYEALPMVLIEAKVCGCVCVSYDCKTGPAEIIRDGEDGFLIPEGKQNLFVEKILNLMDDKALMERMGARAMVNAKDYSPNEILPKWKQLLNEVYDCQ